MAEMKGIKLCGECGNYDWKKHKCKIGCNDDSNAQASFYGDCPLPDVVPKSEVEKWKQINEQLHKEMSERMVEERKIERKLAVCQIICDLLSCHTPDVDGFFTIHESELAELKKKYTEGEHNE